MIFMLTEGDGCDSADSHVPRGVRLVLTFPPGLPSLCQAFALLCPLLSFNIWSLFSISNTRAPAMTPLLKMPRIGKVFWVFLFFFPPVSGLTRTSVYCEGMFASVCVFSPLQVLFLRFCSICSAHHHKPNTAKLLSR